MKLHKYTQEEDQFLKDNVRGISVKELVDRFNKHFNLNLTYGSIKAHKERLGLKNGIDARFQKGNAAFNKGKTWDEYMSKKGQENSKKTWFSSTDRSKQNSNNKPFPLFSERIDVDGYTLIKIENPSKWVFKHKWLYEQYHNCKVPKGFVVTFLDGNKQNLDINNLAMISQNQNKIMNKRKLRYENAELTKAGIKVTQLIETIEKRKGEMKNGR